MFNEDDLGRFLECGFLFCFKNSACFFAKGSLVNAQLINLFDKIGQKHQTTFPWLLL